MTVQTGALNVLTQPTATVYLNDPIREQLPVEEDKTEPLEPSGNDEPTSANLNKEDGVDWKKRHDDLKRHYDTGINNAKATAQSQIDELKTQIAELTNRFSEKVTAPTMPKTPDEFKAFQEKYPELAGQIMTAAMMASASSATVIEQKLKQLEEKANAASAREGINELKKYHPDFEQIKDDPRFIEWFNMQPAEIKNLIRSPNPKVIATGLDRFKEYAGIKTQVKKQEAKLDATRDVKTPGRVAIGEGAKRTYTNAEIMKMSITEFEKNQDDIKAAQYEGRIVG